jgi:TonB family protein
MIALLLISAAATAQHPAKTRPIFSVGDYPDDALSHGEQGTAFVRVLIDTTGRVDTCTVLESTGYPDLDRHTCALIQTRAKFVPAEDENGVPVFALCRIPVTWALGCAPEVTVNPAFDITINQGPRGVRLPLKMNVAYFVTPAGTITKCHQSGSEAPPVLVDLACKTATATPFGIVRDHTGNPVGAMDGITVRFNAKP